MDCLYFIDVETDNRDKVIWQGEAFKQKDKRLPNKNTRVIGG